MMRISKVKILIGVLVVLAVTELDTLYNQRKLCRELLAHRSLSSSEYCMGYWPEGTGLPGFWETRFEPIDHNLKTQIDIEREWPSTDVAYVVTFTSCPDDANFPGIKVGHDAGSAFYDAAATLKHSICENSDDNTYGYAIYAIIHPDAVMCKGPNGVDYDRARVLQSLGYWVKIWGLPVGLQDLDAQPYIAQNIENDVGLKDLIKLNALNLESEFVVLLDSTYHMKEPLDPIFQSLSGPEVKAAYVLDPNRNSISMSPLIMKTGQGLYDELVEIYKNTPFTAENGWGGSGMGLFPGGIGTSGLLSYYFLFENQDAGDQLDRCLFANNGAAECTNSVFADIYGFTMTDSVCGQPWSCEYPKFSWSSDTKEMCKSFFMYWMQSRYDYQSSHLGKVGTENDGTYYPDVFNGYCNDVGQENYIHMLDAEAKLEVCETLDYIGCEPHDTIQPTTIAGGAELELKVLYPPSCSVFIAEPGGAGADVKFSGTAEAKLSSVSQDTSIVFVVDRSGSTCDATSLGCSSDVIFDSSYDDILDCEIAAVLDMVNKLQTEGTVEQVGLVSFASNINGDVASVDLELSDISTPFRETFNDIGESIRSVPCGGSTNYAGAVAAACSVIEQSTSTHNLVVFLSDGLQTQGDGVQTYCSNHAVFHTIAVGPNSACTSPHDTSLEKIAIDTGGTCTRVFSVPDLREVMKSLTDVSIDGITGGVSTLGNLDFGCTDLPDWRNEVNMGCAEVTSPEYTCDFFGMLEGVSGITGNEACCGCGGGESLPVGQLNQTKDEGLYREFNHTIRIPPGEHDVCTTLDGSAVGKPGVNKQCRKIYVCPHPHDGIPG